MEFDDRLRYNFACESSDDEVSGIVGSQYTRLTVDSGIDSSRAATFQIDGSSDSLIDLSKCFIKTTFRIVKEDGNLLGDKPKVFPIENSALNLWSSVSIALNNTPLPPSNDYALTANLVNLVGATPEARDVVMGPLLGYRESIIGSSKIKLDTMGSYDEVKRQAANSKSFISYSRVYSDFLQTCAQVLPYGMSMTLVFNRAKDAFALGDDSEVAHPGYRINVESVSLFIKRIYMSVPSMGRIKSSIESGGKLCYQRLQTVVYPCAERQLSFTHYGCFHGILPRSAYLFLVSQEAYYGSYKRNPLYYESADISRVIFMTDGREVMAEPYKSSFKYHPKNGTVITDSALMRYTTQLELMGEADDVDTNEETALRQTLTSIVGGGASDALSPFAGLCRTVSSFSNPRDFVGIPYHHFLDGATIFAVSLDHDERMTAMRGSFDVTIEFRTPLKEPMMVVIVGEYPKTISFDCNKNISEV